MYFLNCRRRAEYTTILGFLIVFFVACGSSLAASAEALTESSVETTQASTSVSSGVDAADASSAAKDPRSLLPHDIRNAGKLILGTDASAPPYAWVNDDGQIVGINPDLAQAVGEVLGLAIDMQNIAFSQSVSSIQTDRVDMYWDWSTDRAKKRKYLDFIDFAKAGEGLIVAEGNPASISGFGDLCGDTVAVQRGSTHVKTVTRMSKSECVVKGKRPINILQFKNVSMALLQIKGGRATAVATASTVCGYIGKTSDQYDSVGIIVNETLRGITVLKSNTKLRDAVASALQVLVNNGVYEKIMEKWGVDTSMLNRIKINGAAN